MEDILKGGRERRTRPPPRSRLVDRENRRLAGRRGWRARVVADIGCRERDGMSNERAMEWVVGVNHDHEVRPVHQGVWVTSFLVAAVTLILRMFDDGQTHLTRDLHGAVLAAVVDQNDFIDRTGGHVSQG